MMNNKYNKWVKLSISLLLILIVVIAFVFTPLGGIISTWLKDSVLKWLNIGGNGDNDGNGNGSGNGSQYYITLIVQPTLSDRKNNQNLQFSVTSNIDQNLYPFSMHYRYKGETVWKTRALNSPENDFFAGYYEWKVMSTNGVSSNVVETVVTGISLWVNGLFEQSFVNVNLGQICYCEDGSTYKNWLVFYYVFNPVWSSWVLVRVARTDSMGKIFGQSIQVVAPNFPNYYPTKATLNIQNSFGSAPTDFEEIQEFEDWLWENDLQNQVPDPNTNSGQLWYVESNIIIGNVA